MADVGCTAFLVEGSVVGDRLLYDELRTQAEPLAQELDRVRDEALKIWAEQVYRSFTAHGQAHFDQVETNLDWLTRPLQASPQRLQPHEIFVLLAACYLHDIGMQLDRPDAREAHAEYAYQLILHSHARVGPDDRRVTLPIDDPNARLAIAEVARAHWTTFALELPQTDYIYGNTNASGRLRLLGVLLAMADLLDLSPARARYFRSIHRLYDLGAVSELHQKMHHWVKGFDISPAHTELQSELQFKLTWRDNHQEVHDTADWVLRWFNSQWRRLAPVLKADSGGAVRWSEPWLNVRFETQRGPETRLSSEALAALQAERAEQRRLDRNEFAYKYNEALAACRCSVFFLRDDASWDGAHLGRWCEARAHVRANTRIGRLNLRIGGRLDVASMVSQLMEGWGEHLPRCSDRQALDSLSAFVASRGDTALVAIVRAGEYATSGVQPVLEAYLNLALPGSGPRVCVVLSRNADGPEKLAETTVHRLCESPYTRDDILTFLCSELGYGEYESRQYIRELEVVRRLDDPGIVRDSIEQRESEALGLV